MKQIAPIILILLYFPVLAQQKAVFPGQPWLDTAGDPISCHGHSVLYNPADSTYYWYGENKERTVKGSNIWTYGIRCYSSKDFYNWKDEGLIIFPETTDTRHPLHYSQWLDRPHILYNEKTDKYVCWIKCMGENDGCFVILQAKHLLGPYELINPDIGRLDSLSGISRCGPMKRGKGMSGSNRVTGK